MAQDWEDYMSEAPQGQQPGLENASLSELLHAAMLRIEADAERIRRSGAAAALRPGDEVAAYDNNSSCNSSCTPRVA